MSQPPNFSNQDSEERLSQTEVIEQLQKTIAQLNSIVFKLNTETVENLPSKLAVDSWVVITERLIESLEPSPVPFEEPSIIETSFTEVEPEPSEPEIPVVVTPEPKPPQPVAKKVDIPKPPQRVIPEKPERIDKSAPSRLQTIWNGILDTVRAFLPTSINEKLSDWLLTGILSGILVLLLLTSVSLLTSSPKKEISQLPKINIEELPVEAPVEVTTPEPILEPIETEKTPELKLEPPKSFPQTSAAPEELTVPEPPKPLAIEPPAPIVLTPEQNLIASIQAEINSLTKQFPEGIVTSLEANFMDGLLTLFVDEDWYGLNESKQLELANSVWKRSQELDFQKIEIKDSDKEIVARSPVVGDKVIIVKSSL